MIRVRQYTKSDEFEQALDKLDGYGARIVSTHVGVDDDGWWYAVVYRFFTNDPLEA